jgi:hypothetical protein
MEHHSSLLRHQLERKGVSTGELPKGHSLVGFDACGFTSDCAGRSLGELASLGNKVECFAGYLAYRFGLLIERIPRSLLRWC